MEIERRLVEFLERNKILPTIYTILSTFFFILLVPFLAYWNDEFPNLTYTIYLSLIMLLLGFSIFALYNSIKNYKIRTRKISGLIYLYAEIIVLFGSIYFLLNIIDPTTSHFAGMEILLPTGPTHLKWHYLTTAINNYFDAIHFSIVTSTTLGYGNIYPTSFIAKIIVNINVLLSMTVAVVGFGNYFATITKQDS